MVDDFQNFNEESKFAFLSNKAREKVNDHVIFYSLVGIQVFVILIQILLCFRNR